MYGSVRGAVSDGRLYLCLPRIFKREEIVFGKGDSDMASPVSIALAWVNKIAHASRVRAARSNEPSILSVEKQKSCQVKFFSS